LPRFSPVRVRLFSFKMLLTANLDSEALRHFSYLKTAILCSFLQIGTVNLSIVCSNIVLRREELILIEVTKVSVPKKGYVGHGKNP